MSCDMVLRHDNRSATMGVGPISQIKTEPSALPFRLPDPQHLQYSRQHIPGLEWKYSSSSLFATEHSVRSPTASCCSHDSFAESEATMSTAPSSPPRSPKKQEPADVSLHSIPSRQLPARPAVDSWARSRGAMPTLPPLDRRASAGETLPRLSSIFPVPRTTPPHSSGITNRLESLELSPSPDPSSTNDYVLAQYSRGPPTHDPITDYLNQKRQEQERQRLSAHIESRRHKLSLPNDRHAIPFSPRSNVTMDFPSPPPLPISRPLPHQPRRSSYDAQPLYPDTSPDILRKVRRGGIEKIHKPQADDSPHINKRYTVEQIHFIRYLKCDCSFGWDVVKCRMRQMFPETDLKEGRKTQGVQGVYYRQNKHLPRLNIATNTIEYLPNGHMATMAVGCRDQKEKATFGILNLWPEWALRYSWVTEEHKQQARRMVDQRRQEREEAHRYAVNEGLWADGVPEENCACCVDRKRDR